MLTNMVVLGPLTLEAFNSLASTEHDERLSLLSKAGVVLVDVVVSITARQVSKHSRLRLPPHRVASRGLRVLKGIYEFQCPPVCIAGSIMLVKLSRRSLAQDEYIWPSPWCGLHSRLLPDPVGKDLSPAEPVLAASPDEVTGPRMLGITIIATRAWGVGFAVLSLNVIDACG